MKTIKQLSMAFFALFFTPVYGQWTDQNSSITNDLEAVYFINSNEGWAVGRQGKIVHTTNAGVTWTLQNSSTTSDLNNVHMVNSSCGYAIGDDGKLVKYNGTTWSTINISFSQDMYGVFFLDCSTGWISGDWGRIMMTTDGGSTWTTQMDNSIYSNTFRDLYMVSANDGWAVGSMGRVLHYNGTGWSNFSSPSAGVGGPDLYAVSFSSASNGFMTGSDSKVYQFDGSAWSEHSTSLPDNSQRIYGVHTISNTLAYACTTPGFGGEGYILKYNGSSWVTDYNYTGMGSELFTGIYFPTASKGYAVGAGGMVKTKGSAGPTAIDEIFENEMAVEAYPNPFTNNVNIEYTLEENTDVQISVFDINGKNISNLVSQQQNAGNHTFNYDGSSLAHGVYYVNVQAGNTVGKVKLVK